MYKMSLKISRKWDQKWVSNRVKSEIAGLRHFLPRRHLLGFFWHFFAWRFGGPWVSLGRLLGFLRVSWEVSGPKNIKTHKVLKGFFKAVV